MIQQNVRSIILHISVALKCDYCKPNVPINMMNILNIHVTAWIESRSGSYFFQKIDKFSYL